MFRPIPSCSDLLLKTPIRKIEVWVLKGEAGTSRNKSEQNETYVYISEIMEFWWIPNKCENLFDDSIVFRFQFQDAMSGARRHESFRRIRKEKTDQANGICERCLQPSSRLDAHHIVPLWSLVVESICESINQNGSSDHAHEISNASYIEWNSHRNIIAVCRACHDGLEVAATQLRKKELLNKYHPHLCFSWSDSKKAYKKYWINGEMINVR